MLVSTVAISVVAAYHHPALTISGTAYYTVTAFKLFVSASKTFYFALSGLTGTVLTFGLDGFVVVVAFVVVVLDVPNFPFYTT